MNGEREARLAWLREERERIERHLWRLGQEHQAVCQAIAEEVTAEAEGR